MNQKIQERFTKYEIARIVGARALQIAMDAPVLLKLSEDELKELDFDAIRIAESELNEDALPIAIHRPTPKKGTEKIGKVKEDKVSDEEIVKQGKEVEKEIVESAKDLGFVDADDSEDAISGDNSTTENQ